MGEIGRKSARARARSGLPGFALLAAACGLAELAALSWIAPEAGGVWIRDAHAEEDQTAKAAGFVSATPPDFTAMNYKMLGTAFSDCLHLPALEKCEQVNPPELDDLDCKKKALFAGKMKQVDEAEKSLNCRKKQLVSIQQEIGCFQKSQTELQAQMATLHGQFMQNYQRMAADMKFMTDVQEDRSKQLEDVLKRLNGDPQTGELGLNDMRKQLTAMVAEMPGEITTVENAVKEEKRQKKMFEESVKIRKMALTSQCFKTKPRENFQCERGGPAVSAYEGILCRYEQNLTLNDAGAREAGNLGKASSGKASLQGVLDSILADIPNNPEVPTPATDEATKAAAAGFSNQPMRYLTLESLKTTLDRLEAYDAGAMKAKGIDVAGFVRNQLKRCYHESEEVVRKELKREGSTLSVQKNQMEVTARANRAGFRGLLTKYGDQFGAMMRTLTGQHLPLDTSACKEQSAESAVNCLKNIQANAEGFANGTLATSKVAVVIPSNHPKTPGYPALDILVTCTGLDGCITTMNNIRRNIEKEVGKIGKQKEKYIEVANRSMEGYASQMASFMSMQSKQIADRFARINQVLPMLGARALVLDEMEGESVEFDEKTGLFKPPQDAVKFLNGKMSPKLYDLSEIGEGLDDITDALSDIDRDPETGLPAIAKARLVIKEMQTLTCEVEKKEKLVEELDERVGLFTECIEYYCKDYPDKIEQIQKTLLQVTNDDRLADLGIEASLADGINCEETEPDSPGQISSDDDDDSAKSKRKSKKISGSCNQIYSQIQSKSRALGARSTASGGESVDGK